MPPSPYSYAQYAGDGSRKRFTVPFPYLKKEHVKVYIDYNLLTGTFASELTDGGGYTWLGDTRIETTVAQPPGHTLTILRTVPTSTPYSYVTYAGTGTTTTFSVPFPYLLKGHIRVYLNFDLRFDTGDSELEDGVGYEWTNDTQIQCTNAPAIGQYLTILRRTPRAQRMVDWSDGSNLIASDLDTADLQLLYLLQEMADRSFYTAEAGRAIVADRATPDDDRPSTFYVNSEEGENSNDGRNPARAFKNIEHALEMIWQFDTPRPWTIMLMDGLYTDGELDVPDFTTIMGSKFQRRTIIRPNPGHEVSNVFRCGNGSHLVNMKFSGWQVDDFSNPAKGFAMTFRPGAIILPGGVPYGQNCVVTSAMTTVPTPLPMNAQLGNPAQPKGGGCVLADASVLSAYSVFPNIMTWGFTPSSHNGLGYVAKNRGFINAVNAIGIGQHRHFMCQDGGQLVVSACSSQFGDYSFWSEGFTQQIAPLKVNPAVIVSQTNAATVINGIRTALVNGMWPFLVANHGAGSWPPGLEALTQKDTGLFLDAISASLVHGFERPMLNFAEGMFRFTGVCVYDYAYHAAFKASWDWLAQQIIAEAQITSGAATFVNALVARLKATMDNYWFEAGLGPAPAPVEPVRRKLRSLITAIGHQWTAPMAGVEFYRVPPARAARRIQRSIRQVGGGRVRFSGQDDAGNAVFVGGLTIDARSGQLGGPPFDSALRGRLTRGVISRSY